jgi:radical SAM superfamily enzyme YgiQ (UPF0313 family)
VNELAYLCSRVSRPYVVFRDPLFTNDRNRVLELCDAIAARRLNLRFEAETRLDRLDADLIDRMHAAGFRAMSFGVETPDAATLKKSGRRPIPEAHQRHIIEHCRTRGVTTAAFYVLGFLQDDWDSVAGAIRYAVELGSTFAQFKILTPYPGTPMFKQLEPRISQTDWERFDGYTPTFEHPALSESQLRFLLGAAYTRFYMRPSFVANLIRLQNRRLRSWIGHWDDRVSRRHTTEEIEQHARAVIG